jgi:two-component system NtrC family sensor kinase
VRPGLRLQILVWLGVLLVLAFLPLYWAVATYTRVALHQIRASHARALGRAVAAQVSEARLRRAPSDLDALLGAEVGSDGVSSIVVYSVRGEVVARAGAPIAPSTLPPRLDVRREATFELDGADGRALGVVVPSPSGAVLAVLPIEDSATRTGSLFRLLALYTGLVALALLLVGYFALTRLIVKPLDQLARAAERVAGGARRFALPQSHVRELAELGQSFAAMTEKLLSDEEALRRKIDEVEAATRSLTEAQQRLIRSERLASVGRLAAGLAHEIGNPIAALIGFLDLLIEGGLEPSEQHDFHVRMRRESERIHGILRDLLQFARPSAKASEPGEPGDVATAVNDTATLVAPQKEMKEIALKLELEPDLPAVLLSREQLVQVVLNLVLNAADAVGAGGHVTVAARARAERVELSVADDGPGVPSAIRERLFEPFATSKEPGKGTGLGLAVCRGLVEAVGGSIALDERHAPGARFVVELPRAGP